MIGWLASRLIPDYEQTDRPEVRRAYGVLCGAVGIALNAVLFAAKALTGAATGSIAVMADAFNNLSDAGSSAITLIGFKISGKRNDSEHPFGHGRAEYVAGLIVAMIIILMGFDLGKTSVGKILSPEPVSFSALSVGILLLAILIKLYMAAYNAATARKIDSVAMRATATDSLSDAVATLAVLLSGLAGRFLGVPVDGYAGALVSLLIFRAGFMAAKETISPLLGNPPDPDFVRRVLEIVRGSDVVCGVHDLVVHDYGAGRTMISLHAEVPADGDLVEMHDQIDNIERRLSRELCCQAVIHMDPIATDDQAVAQVRSRVLQALQEKVDARVTVHDFRMVAGSTHTNVIFDALVPLEVDRSDAELKSEIRRIVEEMEGDYFAVVTIDRPYVSDC